MNKTKSKTVIPEILLTAAEFLEKYNRNMPKGYPLVTMEVLQKFKNEHTSMFKNHGLWSLDQHRKRMIDWLPQNL